MFSSRCVAFRLVPPIGGWASYFCLGLASFEMLASKRGGLEVRILFLPCLAADTVLGVFLPHG